MHASAEKRLEDLGLVLPNPPKFLGFYAAVAQTGTLLFVSGMLLTEGRGEFRRPPRREIDSTDGTSGVRAFSFTFG